MGVIDRDRLAAAIESELATYRQRTPVHNMALMCPTTSVGDVDRHTELFEQAVENIAPE